jgi:hypothetical protein
MATLLDITTISVDVGGQLILSDLVNNGKDDPREIYCSGICVATLLDITTISVDVGGKLTFSDLAIMYKRSIKTKKLDHLWGRKRTQGGSKV